MLMFFFIRNEKIANLNPSGKSDSNLLGFLPVNLFLNFIILARVLHSFSEASCVSAVYHARGTLAQNYNIFPLFFFSICGLYIPSKNLQPYFRSIS